MSDYETVETDELEELQPDAPSTESLVDALARGDAMSVTKAFNDLMAGKVSDALEAEKVKVASTIFNGASEEEDISDEEFDAALGEVESEVESEVEDDVSTQFEQEFDADEEQEIQSDEELESTIEDVLSQEDESVE